jgi:hypothetical protein
MNEQNFSLQPFQEIHQVDLRFNGSIIRNANLLTIHYALLGDLENIEIPPPVDISERQHELWETTCFEFFVGIKNSPRYWEFNLSPAGHWNVYRFDDYRQGMQEEMAIMSLPFIMRRQSDALLLKLEVDLDKFIPVQEFLDIAITSVIQLKGGNVSYWALKHCSEQADFHRRDSFIIDV